MNSMNEATRTRSIVNAVRMLTINNGGKTFPMCIFDKDCRCNFYEYFSPSKIMQDNECWIKSKNNENWTVIEDCSVSMSVTRRIQRTIVRGNEGDDILDEGSESVIYSVTGGMSVSEYRRILKIFRDGEIFFRDPFEEKDISAIISKIEYDGNQGSYFIEIIEDVDISW